MKLGSCVRGSLRTWLMLGGVLAALPSAWSQATPQLIDTVTVTATRSPAPVQTVGSAVDVISGADLARRQLDSFASALGSVPGAPVFPSGALGATASLFLRGSNSNQTLFLVDGMRLNDPNTDYNLFLGGACVSACDSLEIAHGPQSTLYGGEAMGGVVSLRSQRGHGAPTARVFAEAGSFGTIQGSVLAQGESGPNAYNVSVLGGHTDNQRANNAFDSATTAIRLDRAVTSTLAIGGTLRWFHGVYGDPGDRYTNDPDNQDREDNVLVTAFADATMNDVWKTHLTLGGQDRRFVAESPAPPAATSVTLVKNRRGMIDWQNLLTLTERNRLTVGLTAEQNHTRNTGFGDIDKSQSLLAFFAQDEFNPVENLYLTAGLRSDDFDTFGRATTGRATIAWLTAKRTLKWRASYGTAFRSPSFLDLYGTSAYYVGNPNLHPEKARGGDVGVDYYLPEKRGSLGVTWFRTDYMDLITYDFSVFPSTVENVERARTQGVEVSGQFALTAATQVRLAYTYLDAKNLAQHTRLLRRPRNSVSADLWQEFGAGFSGGAGVVGVSGRQDIDAATFATIDAEDYTVVRVYAAYQATPSLAFKIRLENLLDEKYEAVNGYPALGFGAFAGVEWKF